MIREARTKEEAMKAFTVSDIMEYEAGEFNDKQTVNLFADLVASGMAWTLQGSYGRMARSLIDSGIIDPYGAILKEVE